MRMPKGNPLAGLKVLELCQFAAGPFAGSLLADLGADVVKVERPNGGDPLRNWAPFSEGKNGDKVSHNFASINRNKRSINLNLKASDGRQQLVELASKADILIENFRPGVLSGLRLGYEDLRSINPKLIYCSVSGYGQTGPYARKGAFDATVQGLSGVMSVTGEPEGKPVKCGVPIGDFCTGLYAALAILAAIRRVEHSGSGVHIDCSMLGSLVGIAALQTSEFFGTGVAPARLGSAHPRNAPYQGFQAKNGYFMLAAGTDELWHRVCSVVSREDLVSDPRFGNQLLRTRNQTDLARILSERFREKTVDEWVTELDANGVPCAPIKDYAELVNDDHIVHMGLIREVELTNGESVRTTGFPVGISDFEFDIYRAPPRLGEHTDDVIADWLGGRSAAADQCEDRSAQQERRLQKSSSRDP